MPSEACSEIRLELHNAGESTTCFEKFESSQLQPQLLDVRKVFQCKTIIRCGGSQVNPRISLRMGDFGPSCTRFCGVIIQALREVPIDERVKLELEIDNEAKSHHLQKFVDVRSTEWTNFFGSRFGKISIFCEIDQWAFDLLLSVTDLRILNLWNSVIALKFSERPIWPHLLELNLESVFIRLTDFAPFLLRHASLQDSDLRNLGLLDGNWSHAFTILAQMPVISALHLCRLFQQESCRDSDGFYVRLLGSKQAVLSISEHGKIVAATRALAANTLTIKNDFHQFAWNLEGPGSLPYEVDLSNGIAAGYGLTVQHNGEWIVDSVAEITVALRDLKLS